MYENTDANQARPITSGTGSFPTVQSTYGDISSSALSNKIALVGDDYGIDDVTVYGYMEPDALVRAWMDAALSGHTALME